MSQPLLYPKSPTICFSYIRYQKKSSVFSVLFSSISLSICFTLFRTETSRNSARLTCHFSYLFLVLLVLILRFGSVSFRFKSKKNKLKFYKETSILFFQSLFYHLFPIIIHFPIHTSIPISTHSQLIPICTPLGYPPRLDRTRT